MSKSDQPAGVAVDRGVRPLVDKRGDICTLALYDVLADLANEAGAVDTVIGRPRALYERLCSLRDTVGAAKASAPASTLPAEWLVKVRRLVQGFEHVSGIARLWEPDYSSGSERALWSRATEACADVAKLLREAEGPNAALSGGPPLDASTTKGRPRAVRSNALLGP